MANPPEDTEIDARDDDSLPEVADLQMQSLVRSKIFGTPPAPVFVGRFQLVRALGQGAMGAVFEAYDEQLRRRVALKILHKAGERSEEERNLRMLREAQTLAQLEHPNVVRVYEAGEHSSQVFMAMELVEGKTLHSRQTEKPPPSWQELLAVYVKAGRGLAAAHDKKVVHRDFKPHNVIIDPDGEVKVVDFGLAVVSVEVDGHPTEELVPSPPGAIDRPPIDRLTASGQTPGTPVYMAPELFEGEPATARSDQFSFCVALYEALIGQRPFFGKTIEELSAAIHEGELHSSDAQRGIPAWLLGALERGLAARAEDRFGSMAELLAELERDRTRWQRRAGAGAALAAAAIIAAGATWWFMGRDGKPVVEEVKWTRIRSCVDDTIAQGQRWAEAHTTEEWAPTDPQDADAMAEILQPQATAYFGRRVESCVADVGEEKNFCHQQSSADMEAALISRDEGIVDRDIFFQLSRSLALCLESSVQGRCKKPTSDELLLLSRGTQARDRGDLNLAARLGQEALSLVRRDADGDPIDDKLTAARAQLLLGAVAERRGEPNKAREYLEDALVDAQSCGDKVLVVDISLELAEVEALHMGEGHVAEQKLRATRRRLKDLGLKTLPMRWARLEEKQGIALSDLERDCNEGRSHLENALAMREEMYERATPAGKPIFARLVADAQLNLANQSLRAHMGQWPNCSEKLGTIDDVTDEYREARASTLRAVTDPLHLDLAPFDFNIALTLRVAGKLHEARDTLLSALRIYQRNLGPDSVDVADTHYALVPLLVELEQYELAEEHALACLRIRRLHDEQLLPLASAYSSVALVAGAKGQVGRSVDFYKQTVSLIDGQDRDGPRAPREQEELRLGLINLAMAQYDSGDIDAAKESIARADQLRLALVSSDGDLPAESAQARLLRVRLLRDAGRGSDAIELLKGIEALPGYDALKGVLVEEGLRPAD